MQLWFIIGALVVGGAERTLVDLVNEMDRDRYEITVWTVFDANPLANELPSDITLRSLSSGGKVVNDSIEGVSNPLAVLLAPVRFWAAARREDPDLIHSFLFIDNIIARVAGVLCSGRVITGVRCVPDERSAVRSILDRATVSLSDVIVSNSRAGAEFAENHGAPADAVEVINNGRDIASFGNAQSARPRLGLDDDDVVVGTVGRLLERKGQFDLLDAWVTIRDRYPDATLLLVGDGPDREALEDHARELDVADSVRFLGTRQDVPELLAAMDVFAFPSHFEGLPGALIEAMASGLPIVATPVDGNGELLDNYHSALFVSVESPDELAWATIRLLEHDNFATTLAETAQRRAKSQYTVERMVEQFELLYDRLEQKSSASGDGSGATA